MAITSQQILDVLRSITDPDLNKDIVSLGFVKNIEIKGGDVSFDIELTTPACPVKSEFQKKAEELVKSIHGVKKVDVRMTAQPMKQPTTTGEIQSTLKTVQAVIAVSSCKGGVGKSTIAAHMALELASRGYKVGLMDADIHGPSVPTIFGLQGTPIYTNEQKQIIPIEKNKLKLMSFGFLLGDAPAVMRGPIVSRYIQQILHGTAWGDLDYLFIDMPPGTGDVQLTITQSVRLTGAVIITTRQTLSLVDVARGILMFEQVNVPILGIIENMSYFMCDQCDKKHYIFGGSGQSELSERFGVETLAEIPLLPQLMAKIEHPIANSFIMDTVDHVIRALGKQRMTTNDAPTYRYDEKNVYLKWNNGPEMSIANRDLRLSCRCALCVNELTGEKILRERDLKSDIAPTKIMSLGNYALAINWNDGHTSGIYPYKSIRELAGVGA